MQEKVSSVVPEQSNLRLVPWRNLLLWSPTIQITQSLEAIAYSAANGGRKHDYDRQGMWLSHSWHYCFLASWWPYKRSKCQHLAREKSKKKMACCPSSMYTPSWSSGRAQQFRPTSEPAAHILFAFYKRCHGTVSPAAEKGRVKYNSIGLKISKHQ